MHCLSSLFSSLTPPTQPKEGNMFRNFFLALCAIAFFLTGCGDWSNYQPCNTPTGCGTDAADGTGGDTDTTPPADDEMSCADFTVLAVTICGDAGVVALDCTSMSFACDTNGDGEGDINVYVTVTEDGDVVVTTGDDSSSGDGSGDDGTDDTGDDSDGDSTQCSDGVDNDGDGLVDLSDSGCTDADDISEVNASSGDYCYDYDLDGYGDPDTCVSSATAGYVNDDTDCNDSNDYIHPGAEEFCDGLDNDCNGVIDDNDSDGDGYYSDDAVCVANYDGTRPDLLTDCADTAGHVNVNGWHDEWVHPGQLDLGDDFDSDCSGDTDEDLIDSATEGCNNAFETSGDGIDDCFDPWWRADRANNDSTISEYTPFDDTSRVVEGVAVTGNVTSEMTATQQVDASSAIAITAIVARICVLTPDMDYDDCLALF